MDLHLEGIVRELRTKLRFESFPGAAGTFVLADYLKTEGHVTVEYAAAPESSARFPLDRPAEITLPLGVPMDEVERQLLHELWHFLVFRHSGAWFARERCPEGWMRLMLLDDDRDEAAVRRGVLAWKLPADLIIHYDREEDLMVDSGCSREEIRERLRDFLAP